MPRDWANVVAERVCREVDPHSRLGGKLWTAVERAVRAARSRALEDARSASDRVASEMRARAASPGDGDQTFDDGAVAGAEGVSEALRCLR